MKRQLLLLTLALTSLISQAQENGTPLSTKLYYYVDGVYELATTVIKTPLENAPEGTCLIQSENTIYFDYYADGDTIAQFGSTYFYDENFLLTNSLETNLSYIFDDPENVGEYLYSYDTDGQMTSVIYNTLENGETIAMNRTIYAYNESGLLESTAFFLWNGTLWYPVNRSTLVYNEFQQTTLMVAEAFNSDDLVWEVVAESHFNYEDGLFVSSAGFQLNEEGVMTPLDSTSTTYDDLGRVLTMEQFYYNQNLDSMMISTLSENTYDEENHLIRIEVSAWSLENQSLELLYKYEFENFCGAIVTDVSDKLAPDSHLTLLGNPSEQLQLEARDTQSTFTIEVYDLTGHLMYKSPTQQGTATMRIAESNAWASGIYQVVLSSSKGREVMKWVKG